LLAYGAAVQPGFQTPSHLVRLGERLEAIAEGRCRRLIVSAPPRHGKSLLTSVVFPSWFLGKRPAAEIIFTTYSQEFSEDHGRKVRNLLGSPIHKAIFPESCLSDDSAAAFRFTTTAGGIYVATGRGGSLTGRGADLMIVDDPLKGIEEAGSAAIRKGLHEWFRSDAFTRLQPNGALIVISTRWHHDDLAGMLQREHPGEGWEDLTFPAIAEADDPLGREEGAALWPERYPLEELQRMRAVVGERAWISLYQGRPVAATGGIFKRDWWQTYREAPAEFQRKVQFWDCAVKSGQENDYSVCTTWGATKTGFYLLHCWRDKVQFPALKKAAVALHDSWGPDVVLIEDASSGSSLVQELVGDTNLPVKAIKVSSDKVTRANAVTPLIETGKVYIPEAASWVAEYLDELSSFPAGKHDDQVDSTVGALGYLRAPTDGWLDYMQEGIEEYQRKMEEG